MNMQTWDFQQTMKQVNSGYLNVDFIINKKWRGFERQKSIIAYIRIWNELLTLIVL